MNLKSLEYFSHRLLDPIYELEHLIQDSNHPEYNNLLYDIKHIDKDQLQEYVEKENIDIKGK